MLKIMKTDKVKPIVLIVLLIGSILFVKTIPVEITDGNAIKEVNYLKK